MGIVRGEELARTAGGGAGAGCRCGRRRQCGRTRQGGQLERRGGGEGGGGRIRVELGVLVVEQRRPGHAGLGCRIAALPFLVQEY